MQITHTNRNPICLCFMMFSLALSVWLPVSSQADSYQPGYSNEIQSSSPPDNPPRTIDVTGDAAGGNSTDNTHTLATQAELDQMLAPIALYPDALLSQVLMASTYPLEIVEAARWSQTNPGLQGDAAIAAARQNRWDPSVLSLLAFPNILDMMNQKLEWTERLGDAFLDQQSTVMDTVQHLRQRAQEVGSLQSNRQVSVRSDANTIIIEQTNPQVVYVPYYNPLVVYGSWWWDTPPVYWDPWPGYVVGPRYSFLYWNSGVNVSAGFFFGGCNWHHHQVTIVNVNNYYYKQAVINHVTVNPAIPATALNRPNSLASHTAFAWQHDPAHRHGVPYTSVAAQQQFMQGGDRRTDTRPVATPPTFNASTHTNEQMNGNVSGTALPSRHPSAEAPSGTIAPSQMQPQHGHTFQPANGNNQMRVDPSGAPPHADSPNNRDDQRAPAHHENSKPMAFSNDARPQEAAAIRPPEPSRPMPVLEHQHPMPVAPAVRSSEQKNAAPSRSHEHH